MKHCLVLAITFAALTLTTGCPRAVPGEKTTPPSETKAGVSPDANSDPLVLGKELYGRVCITCHGAAGDGRGLEQQLFSFATPESEWKNGPTPAGIRATLRDGIHETSMQKFDSFGDAQHELLAGYVLHLRSQLQTTAPSAP